MDVDRELPNSVRRRTRYRSAAAIVVPVVLLGLVLVWLPGWLRPSIALARVRTAVVTSGAIDATVTASGLVVPAIERVLSSPLDARVLRILKRPGAALATGDAVLELDVSDAQVALERSMTDLQVKENLQQQTRLSYEKALVDLDGRLKVKALELESRRATLDKHRKLAGLGLLSKEELRASELAVQQADIELEQLRDERSNAGRTTALQIEGLALERGALSREVGERRKQLELATTKADRNGVLTWVVSEEGALVRRGEVLARIADLSSFRVDATASDVHAGQLRTGLPVAVRIDAVTLEGRVSEVYPTVENGAIRFIVSLDNSGERRLRPSLRADVQVVTDHRARVLKVARGAFADGSGTREVFVVQGRRAVRRTVDLGVASFDEIEVRSGLAEGDTVITSDMRDYLHLTALTVR